MATSQANGHAGETLLRIDAVIGNADEDDWPERLRDARIDVLVLDQAEAQKSRLRKATEGGRDVAISLDRGVQLRDGDVLLWDDSTLVAVVARIDLKDVLVIELAALATASREVALATSIELGHALGNQHWPAVVKGTKVYVPLTLHRTVMASVMKTHALEGVTYTFVPGAEVIPYLAPHEARRLFGGAEEHSHIHADVAAAPALKDPS